MVSARASFSTTPFQSFTASMSSRRLWPANTAEPIAPGWKREPSSFVQATAITGRRVLIPASSSASSASNAASTPYMPSKRPPVGWLSICEPLITGGALPSAPSRRTNRLPIASVKIWKPRAAAHLISRLRAAASSADSAWRLTPPFGVPPNFAMSACRCHRRSSRTAAELSLRAAPIVPPHACRQSYTGPIVGLQSPASMRGPMHNHLDRNLVGYGPNAPDPQWPGEARVAVSFVLNYEEGGENTVLNGDPASEVFLTETPGGAPWVGERDFSTESMYEYGSRAGFWRILRLFDERGLKFTSWAVGRALELNPAAGKAMAQSGHEVASHGYRWINYRDFTLEQELDHMDKIGRASCRE